jgi:cytochrome P450
MSAYSLHHNETLYPDSHAFSPERWLADPETGSPPAGPDGKRLLTQYMGSFSRGTRSCVGINLAWAELYFLMAELFRKVDMEIYESSARDVQIVKDSWVMAAYEGNQGVRVLIK